MLLDLPTILVANKSRIAVSDAFIWNNSTPPKYSTLLSAFSVCFSSVENTTADEAGIWLGVSYLYSPSYHAIYILFCIQLSHYLDHVPSYTPHCVLHTRFLASVSQSNSTVSYFVPSFMNGLECSQLVFSLDEQETT